MGVHESIAQHVLETGNRISDILTTHHFSDNLYCKEMAVPAGYLICKHKHDYSHLSVLAKGRVIVAADDFVREYTAPAVIEIKANVMHAIEAVEDSVWLCIHATDEKDADKVDQVLIERGK